MALNLSKLAAAGDFTPEELRRMARDAFLPHGHYNRSTVRAMVIGALHDLGGQRWLTEQANRYPVAFMALVGKYMAMEAREADDTEVTYTVITSGRKRLEEKPAGVLNTPLMVEDARVVE